MLIHSIDPFNDFLSESGKLWSLTKETVKGVNLIENLKNILSAATSPGIKVVYIPHHLTEKGDFADWKFLAPTHQGSLDNSLFEKEVGVENSNLNSCLKAAILLPKTIGLPVALQIQTLIFC